MLETVAYFFDFLSKNDKVYLAVLGLFLIYLLFIHRKDRKELVELAGVDLEFRYSWKGVELKMGQDRQVQPLLLLFMPQLDKFTYFTQFFWSCLFFFTFYILICNDRDGVLGISRILKLRNQLLSHRGNNIQSKDPNSLEDILRKGFNTGVSYMYSSLFEVSQWCKAVDLFGKRTKITLISCFGEIIGSGGIEGNILDFILQSSSGWGGKNDITPIHALNGQESGNISQCL